MVPNWNFCNNDNLDMDGTMSKLVCQFCIKEKTGHRCALYNQTLSANGQMIEKLRACCRATAGFKSDIAAAPQQPMGPTVDPKQHTKHAIDSYQKTVEDLMRKGYPRDLASNVARKYMLDK